MTQKRKQCSHHSSLCHFTARSFKQTIGVAVLSAAWGAALVLAFAPFNFYIMAFIAPAALLWIWLHSTPRQAGYHGFLFGIGFFSAGVSWIYISIHDFGHASGLLSFSITGLFVLFLSTYFAIQGYLSRRLFQRRSLTIQSLCVFPASWVITESIRASFLTGFPWLLLGYSQTHSPLSALIPLLGIYGLSLVTCLIDGALVLLIIKQPSFHIKCMIAIPVIALFITSWALHNHLWTKLAGHPIKISLIQGNIAQETKWKPKALNKILKTYQTMTQRQLKNQLIVWPEAAVPDYPQKLRHYYQKIDQIAKKHSAAVIIGSPLFDTATGNRYNGLQMIGIHQGLYYKRHLVPFGEYMPYPTIFQPLIQAIDIPMSDFSKGPLKQKLLSLGSFLIAPFICYEIAFSTEVLQQATHAQLLVNISDDSWFGHSIALYQQLQMAQFRALETGRFILCATNTGITAIINPLGKIIAALPINQPASLTGLIYPMKHKTPLMRWHYQPTFTIVILLLLISACLKLIERNR